MKFLKNWLRVNGKISWAKDESGIQHITMPVTWLARGTVASNFTWGVLGLAAGVALTLIAELWTHQLTWLLVAFAAGVLTTALVVRWAKGGE